MTTVGTDGSEGGARRPPLPLRLFFAALDRVTRAAFYLSAVLLAVIVAIYCLEIVLRYAFVAPTVWAHDTVTYLLCAMVFLAAPEAARTNGHIAVTVLVESVPERWRDRIAVVLALATMLIVAAVTIITFQEAQRLFSRNILTLGTVAVPKWWISAFIPLGFGLVTLQFASQFLARARRSPVS